ncbi:MAG TPA: energy transducer TonB [Candidatus Eisenbacteria bacterium]|uniref:Protein TonB n=1 Tax=Eiseniibacteriota bacterium TaxID=2212470 RepID=A0A7V2AVK0_UNCEI|nr:energy transducer TonB [Candidatus Eisenbacteria bacterium]
MEEAKEPEKPKPEQKNEFTPDLARPDLSRHSAIDVGVAVNLGGMAAQDIGGQFVFEAYELDQPPQVIARTPPVYPYKAREKGIEGAVQIKLLVNLNGSVGQVIILDARPPGYFEDAVMKNAQNWKFAPGRIGGEAVTAWVVTTVRFQL